MGEWLLSSTSQWLLSWLPWEGLVSSPDCPDLLGSGDETRRRLYITNLSSENNLLTFWLRASFVILENWNVKKHCYLEPYTPEDTRHWSYLPYLQIAVVQQQETPSWLKCSSEEYDLWPQMMCILSSAWLQIAVLLHFCSDNDWSNQVMPRIATKDLVVLLVLFWSLFSNPNPLKIHCWKTWTCMREHLAANYFSSSSW